jgi:hypothetical protein
LDSATKFLHVVRSKTGMMFTDLRPNEFDWIEFRSVRWEAIDMQATMMPFDKLLRLRTDMNFVIVPDQNDLA